MTSSAPRGEWSAFGRARAGGACSFVLLILLVGAERRLADAHFNLRTAVVSLESDEVLDGDEIRVRLIVLNDDKAPTIADVGRTAVPLVARIVPTRRPSLALGRPAPRGPPRASSSHA